MASGQRHGRRDRIPHEPPKSAANSRILAWHACSSIHADLKGRRLHSDRVCIKLDANAYNSMTASGHTMLASEMQHLGSAVEEYAQNDADDSTTPLHKAFLLLIALHLRLSG